MRTARELWRGLRETVRPNLGPRRLRRGRTRNSALQFAVLEALESRILLSVTATGASTAVLGASYVLTLDPLGQNVSGWTIDWGDTDNPGHSEPVSGSNTTKTVSHTYLTNPGNLTIMAHATVGGVTQDAPNLQITVTGTP